MAGVKNYRTFWYRIKFGTSEPIASPSNPSVKLTALLQPTNTKTAILGAYSKQELLLAVSGGLFVVETFSVVVQVLSLKWRGKRVFKMAPIHHHFELLGWQESKITVRFGIISLVLCLLALITLKLR